MLEYSENNIYCNFMVKNDLTINIVERGFIKLNGLKSV